MISRSYHRVPGRRHALTLLELLLVLSLLVVLASVCWPALQRPMADRRLRMAADQVRTEWIRSRLDAIRSGHACLFRCIPGDEVYSLTRPKSDESPMDEEALGDTGRLETAEETDDSMRRRRHTLPEGVFFVPPPAGSETHADPTLVASDRASEEESGWSEPILFYPDGTTSTARLMLENTYGRCIELSLRGLTGVVTVGSVLEVGE